ncbi:hypothetical protein bcgnr5398_55540 [Bacillus cereus]
MLPIKSLKTALKLFNRETNLQLKPSSFDIQRSFKNTDMVHFVAFSHCSKTQV